MRKILLENLYLRVSAMTKSLAPLTGDKWEACKKTANFFAEIEANIKECKTCDKKTELSAGDNQTFNNSSVDVEASVVEDANATQVQFETKKIQKKKDMVGGLIDYDSKLCHPVFSQKELRESGKTKFIMLMTQLKSYTLLIRVSVEPYRKGSLDEHIMYVFSEGKD